MQRSGKNTWQNREKSLKIKTSFYILSIVFQAEKWYNMDRELIALRKVINPAENNISTLYPFSFQVPQHKKRERIFI